MMDETDTDDGARPEAAVNEGNELKHSHLLPPYQKEGYTLLRETYLKTPGANRNSNYTNEN